MNRIIKPVNILISEEPAIVCLNEFPNDNKEQEGEGIVPHCVVIVYQGFCSQVLCTDLADAESVRDQILTNIPADMIESKQVLVTVMSRDKRT
jgi:hypothetical protein